MKARNDLSHQMLLMTTSDLLPLWEVTHEVVLDWRPRKRDAGASFNEVSGLFQHKNMVLYV